MNNKVIFLLDMDAFFASCHSAINPELKNKNLVVSSPNKRGIVTTASYNARKFGIKAGMPIFKAKELCKDLFIAYSDFKLYVDFSQKVFDIIFNNFSKKIQVASIDECYIDVTNEWRKYKSVKAMAQEIINKISKELNLSCSIGISTNKFLAKTAVDFNKPSGISFLLPEEIEEKMWPLPIKNMYGVGIVTEKQMLEENINTIGDLARSNQETIIKKFGKRGITIWNNANGIGDDVVQTEDNEFKSIGNEMTLDYTTNVPDEIEEIIRELSLSVSKRASQRFLIGKTVTIVLKYERNTEEVFNKIKHNKHLTSQQSLSDYTNSSEIIFATAKECFYEIWNGKSILLLGVRLSNLIDEIKQNKQISINDYLENKVDNLSNIDNLLKELNFTYGKNVFSSADGLEKDIKKIKGQSKFLREDAVHLSNEQLFKKWSKKKGE